MTDYAELEKRLRQVAKVTPAIGGAGCELVEAADAISALTKQLEERDRVATEAVTLPFLFERRLIHADEVWGRIGFSGRTYETDVLSHKISALTKQLEERDRVATEAVEFIGVMRDEMVIAGWPSGDRTVLLANVRALLSTAPSAEGSDV